VKDEILLGPTAATLMVYVWQASGAAGTFCYHLNEEEVA
jgi:hypothetical protein